MEYLQMPQVFKSHTHIMNVMTMYVQSNFLEILIYILKQPYILKACTVLGLLLKINKIHEFATNCICFLTKSIYQIKQLTQYVDNFVFILFNNASHPLRSQKNGQLNYIIIDVKLVSGKVKYCTKKEMFEKHKCPLVQNLIKRIAYMQ